MACSTPVVFLIFRRPDLTAQVFEAIRQVQPAKLLVVADGPRNAKEAVLCQQARAITENIDWNCEVLRNYSDVNMGCLNRVSSGLTWAFDQVEEAIILEDDCLPHPSFFRYCETLLEHYREDERLMVISGNNFQRGRKTTPYSYYFSKYSFCWGWASWRRAWKHWKLDPQKWVEFRNSGLMKSLCNDAREEKFWINIFNTIFLQNKADAWAYIWTFACWSQGGLTALPHVNLVANIGFGSGSTHTGGKSRLANILVEDVGLIKHPPFIVQNLEADNRDFDYLFKKNLVKSVYIGLLNFKSKLLRKLLLSSK